MNPSTRTNLGFIGLILLLFLAFFPGLFHSLWNWPLTFLFASPVGLSNKPASRHSSTPNTMSWFQKTFTLPAKSRGSYLITDQVVKELPEIRSYKVGLLNLFVQHTSCGMSFRSLYYHSGMRLEAEEHVPHPTCLPFQPLPTPFRIDRG